MRITLVTVGKLKERFWTDAAAEYLKRLKPYADVHVVEVTDRDLSRDERRAMADEAKDVLRAVPESSHAVVLEIGGRMMSSEQFAARLAALALDGRSSITFVIGGAAGLDPAVLERADERMSLGPMTLPHNLARVVLLEQVYRAFRIQRGEPYHR